MYRLLQQGGSPPRSAHDYPAVFPEDALPTEHAVVSGGSRPGQVRGECGDVLAGGVKGNRRLSALRCLDSAISSNRFTPGVPPPRTLSRGAADNGVVSRRPREPSAQLTPEVAHG